MAENAGVSLGDLLGALRLRWRLGLATFLAICAGTVAYAYSLPHEYTAKAVVALTPRPGGAASATEVEQLGQAYVAYVTAPTTMRTIGPEVGLTPDALGGHVSADVATGSVNLTIKVQLPSPHRATAAANTLAAAVVTFADNDKLLSATTVAPAVVPTSPSKPRRKLIEGAGLLVALIVATALALIVERGRPRVRSPMEVAYITGHGVLTRVPSSRSVRGGVRNALADPLVGGAIRSLRTVLDQVARDEAIRVLGVTSSVPGEGKSTVSAMLASAIATLDAQVLLIDADLRHPNVHRLLGVQQRPGLVEVLGGQATLADAAQQLSDVRGLSVIGTTGVAETGDLLAKNLAQVLRAAGGQYDVVIVDTPPLLVGDDAGTIATMCDAVLMVVSGGTETRRVGEAARNLDAVNARVIGVVLNRADVASYGYTYRTGGSSSRRGDASTVA